MALSSQPSASPCMHLPADSPGEWLARHVCMDLAPEQRQGAVPTSRLVEGGWLREVFERIAPEEPRRLHYITELSTWYPGTIAMELGYAFVGAGAGFVPTADQVRWVLHERGWAEGIVFAPATRAVVTAEHAWAGRPDVTVVSSRDDVRRSAIEAIVELTAPLVEHLVAVTRAGRYGLWHEVADALPGVLTWDGQLPVTADLVEDFEAMLSRPENPWRRRPTLELVDEAWGSVCIEQRAGCCMAYISHKASDDPDDAHLRYDAELPEPESQRRYCLNCKFRTPEDSRMRQLWWRRHEAMGS